MSYILFLLPPVVSIIVLIIAIKKGFNKSALYISIGITMLINMFAMHHLTLYGFLCTLTIPLTVIYLIICFFLSISERRE